MAFLRLGIDASSRLARRLTVEARHRGATLIGYAPVSRWQEFDEVPAAYRPRAIWRQTESVIVLGVPMLLPIVESTPSINYQEMYTTSNILLDQIAYGLSLYLNESGYASIPMPRDGYGSLDVLLEKMPGCFSHVYAAKYAGLGTIGYSHNLLTPEYGPRVRLVSIFTAARLPATPMQTEELCARCGVCDTLCPTRAFSPRADRIAADFDARVCTRYHQKLLGQSRFPCGVCVKVCPVGEDRRLYRREGADYVYECDAIRQNPLDPEFAHLVHLRAHGSLGGKQGLPDSNVPPAYTLDAEPDAD